METKCRGRAWLRRFSVQLSLFVLGVGLAVILLLCGAVYFFASNLLMSETVSKTHNLLDMSGTNISTYIARVKGEANVFSSDPTLRRYLSEDGKRRKNDPTPDRNLSANGESAKSDSTSQRQRSENDQSIKSNSASQRQTSENDQSIKRDSASQRQASENDQILKSDLMLQIRTLMKSDPYIKSIVVVSKDGRILSNEKNLSMSVSADMMKEDWYKEAIHNTMPVLTGARMQSFSSDKDNWVISVSAEVKGNSGENLGVLLMDMQYRVIEDHLRSLDLGADGYVFILNHRGQPVYHKDTSYFSDPAKQKQLLDMEKAGNQYYKRKNLLTYQTPIENTGWTMVGVVSLDTLQMLERQLFEAVLFTGGLLFLAVVMLGIPFTRRLSTPMSDLEQGMREIEKLAFVKVRKNSFYEVELLADNYNRMIERIRRLMEEISDKEKTLRQAELSALISQINPHFLYNTLDTIIWMAEFNDSAKVIALTKSLAAFFRLSLNSGRELITVEDELDHVRQYLYIQKERYGDKLNYRIEAPDELLDYTVPKIILQPIVENSIYHGIKPLDESGLVTITVHEENERLLFTIADNGVGFPPDDMTEGGSLRLGSVGLGNVDERIKLYYGPEFGLTIQSAPGEGCTVVLAVGKKTVTVH